MPGRDMAGCNMKSVIVFRVNPHQPIIAEDGVLRKLADFLGVEVRGVAVPAGAGQQSFIPPRCGAGAGSCGGVASRSRYALRIAK